MHITFLGDSNSPSFEALVQQAIKNGHTAISINSSIKSIFTILKSFRINMNTIHVHGWKSGFLASFLRIISPRHTHFILTVDSLPTSIHSTLLPIITNTFDRICVSSRTVQYQLLSMHAIHSLYVPNGYTEPILEDIEPRVYGLRNNQYGVILSQSIHEIEHIMKAYATTASKKKIVVFGSNPSAEYKRIQKKYPLLTLLDLPLDSRGAQSVIRRAGFVLFPNSSYTHLLLQSMDSNRTIIATTSPLIEEIMGITGFYYSPTDFDHLAQLLALAAKGELAAKYPPSTRAQHHFSWEQIGLEYDHLYGRKTMKMVPFDSVIARNPQ